MNPAVDHPRWSQATERRIGELGRRKTLPFNGYADEVAGLYAGMDLRKKLLGRSAWHLDRPEATSAASASPVRVHEGGCRSGRET